MQHEVLGSEGSAMGVANSIEVYQGNEIEDAWRKEFGDKDYSLWKLFKDGYNEVVDSIIRPARRRW